MGNKKKILLLGYYGMGNLGDELILEAVLKSLRERFGDAVELRVSSGNPSYTSGCYGVTSVDRKKIIPMFLSVMWCDFLLFGGGGLFQDKTSNMSLYYYLYYILLGKMIGKKVVLYSVGIDRLKKFNRIIAGFVMGLADFISVRDRVSYDFLASSKVAASKVRLSADPVLFYEPARQTNAKPTGKVPSIAFVISEVNGLSPDFWAQIADSCVQRLKTAARFFVFHKRKDLEYTRRTANLMRNKPEIIVWNKPEEVLREYPASDMVISTRLHGMILAALFGIPLCGISNEMKADLFLAETGQKNIYRLKNFNESSVETVLGVVADMLRYKDEFSAVCASNIERLKARLSSAFDEFAKFLQL